MSEDKQEKAIRRAVDRELCARGYDNYPMDYDLFEEALDDITAAIMRVVREGKDD